MDKLNLLVKFGGVDGCEKALLLLKKFNMLVGYTITLSDGFTFHTRDLYQAWSNPTIGYDNGIKLACKSKCDGLILSNEYGYLGYYWGYKSFRPDPIISVFDLEILKSKAIENGFKIDWSTYQWVLNNFKLLASCGRSIN